MFSLRELINVTSNFKVQHAFKIFSVSHKAYIWRHDLRERSLKKYQMLPGTYSSYIYNSILCTICNLFDNFKSALILWNPFTSNKSAKEWPLTWVDSWVDVECTQPCTVYWLIDQLIAWDHKELVRVLRRGFQRTLKHCLAFG